MASSQRTIKMLLMENRAQGFPSYKKIYTGNAMVANH